MYSCMIIGQAELSLDLSNLIKLITGVCSVSGTAHFPKGFPKDNKVGYSDPPKFYSHEHQSACSMQTAKLKDLYSTPSCRLIIAFHDLSTA